MTDEEHLARIEEVLDKDGVFLSKSTSQLARGPCPRPTMTKSEPVGISEIAERLGQRRQTVAIWHHRGQLPDPRWTVSGNPAWEWADIDKWWTERPKS